MKNSLMELLAPAGSWEAFLAAIKNGADAVYLGGKDYSARQSAANFDDGELVKAVKYAHLRGKKIYVTVNTLIDAGEFEDALDYLNRIHQFGVDGVIIQDVGLMNAARQLLPQLRLHASTQMTIHNSAGVEFMRGQGIQRVVLARELSLAEITAISKTVKGVELEVFVHGALCYSYSGQCLFSSMVGGRSGNRGRCAQPCRLPYQLLADGKEVNLSAQGQYLLSPADLCLVEYLPELYHAGVNSLKIEGRLKRPEYVAVVTRAYREVLDALRENDEFRPGAEVKARLLKIFNRNFSTGHFIKNPGSFLSSKRPNNRGVYVGRVVEQDRAGLTRIKLTDTVNAGDGLAVWVTRGKAPAWTVKTMQVNGRDTGQAHSGEYVDISLPVRVSAGDRVFKTHDAMLISQALESIRSENEHRLPVDAQVFLKAGQPLKLVFKDDEGHQAVACTPSAARNAENQALDQGTLRAKIGRLGNTPFVLRNLDMDGEGGLIVPFSDINEARRAAARDLEETILRDREPRKADTLQFINKKKAFLKNTAELKNIAPPLLTVAVSNASQVRIALDNGADLVYLGLEGLGSRKPVTPDELLRLQSQAVKSGREVIPLLPRIHQEDDRISCTDLMKSSFTKVMAGNWGDFALARQQNLTILADSSFNVFNPWSLAFLLEQGARTVCISPELNFNQLQSWPKFAKVEMLIHGELMLAPSKFCMLGEVLKGENGRCRSVCTQASYCLRDDKGYQFPLAADANCRFYAFNSRTLCLAEDLPRILELGPACIRIEARLPHDSLAPTVSLYREAIDRLLNGEKIELDLYAEELLKCSASAHTKGHYYRGVL